MAVPHRGLDPWAVQLRIGERDARHALGAILGPAPGRLMRWADGVLPSTTIGDRIVDLRVIDDDPPSLKLRVYPGQAVISLEGQGPYVCTLDTTGHIQLDDADQAHPRLDLLVARIWDERLGDPLTAFAVEPITGTAAPEPRLPELPKGAIPLGAVPVPPGAKAIETPVIADLRRAAAVRTGVGVLLPGDDPVRPGAYAGQTRYRSGALEAWDGGLWRATHAVDAQDTTTLAVHTGQTGLAGLASLKISDPGWPYRLLVSGAAELANTECRADLHVRLDAPDGPVLAVACGPHHTGSWVTTPMRTSGVLIGPHEVHLAASRVYGPGTWANTPHNGCLTALRIPA